LSKASIGPSACICVLSKHSITSSTSDMYIQLVRGMCPFCVAYIVTATTVTISIEVGLQQLTVTQVAVLLIACHVGALALSQCLMVPWDDKVPKFAYQAGVTGGVVNASALFVPTVETTRLTYFLNSLVANRHVMTGASALVRHAQPLAEQKVAAKPEIQYKLT